MEKILFQISEFIRSIEGWVYLVIYFVLFFYCLLIVRNKGNKFLATGFGILFLSSLLSLPIGEYNLLYSLMEYLNIYDLIIILERTNFFANIIFAVLFIVGLSRIVNSTDIAKEKIMETSEIETTPGGQEFHYSKDPTVLTNFLKTMLWISLGISILSLLSDFMQMNLLSSGTFSQAQAEANDSRQQIMGILYFTAFVVTGIAFLKWIHRVNSNCHGFGAQGMVFTPGWSIGYYFIPFVNLYKPYRAMKEIWKVSTNPTNWQNEQSSPILGWWWALWLLSGFFGQLSFRMSMRADTVSFLQASTTVSIISGIIDIPFYIVAVSLVSAIFTKQERLVRKNV